jgi:glycosyltransferase involved in cell wall biosynthesis
MVMIEAMASGTPVIAFSRGAVPEVLEHGISGLIVDGVDEAVGAVANIGDLDRAGCRREFEQRFTAARMTDDYLAVYDRLLAARTASAQELERLRLMAR